MRRGQKKDPLGSWMERSAAAARRHSERAQRVEESALGRGADPSTSLGMTMGGAASSTSLGLTARRGADPAFSISIAVQIRLPSFDLREIHHVRTGA
jgi:hypothetical protein